MDIDENFYDDFSSFIMTPDDYNLDELDEILRSTDNSLNASLDMSNLVPEVPTCSDFAIQNIDTVNPYNFNLNAYPSPATTELSSLTPPYDSQRTSSTSSSVDEDNNFNPDDFINFLTDDDLKMEHSTADSGHETNHRGTPSPTGSCTSSIGSSTSGIQSDISSVASMSQNCSTTFVQEIKNEPDVNIVDCKMETPLPNIYTQQQQTTTAVLPITVPVLPVTNGPLPPAQIQSTGFNVLQGTLIPVKTMPVTAVTSVTSIQAPIPIQIEPKLAPKITAITPKPTGTLTAANVVKNVSANKSSGPSNTKPKTVFLSSNDFKALMLKLNTNGKGGAKISGSMNGQLPKIVMKTTNSQVVSNGNKIITQNGKVATQFVPTKIVKTTAPLIIKQEPAKATSTMKATNLSRVTTSAACSSVSATVRPPDINIYKGIVDEKTMKKQQRMIKNRESASLSRKKKKEYVVSLESRISDLEKENITLKGENASLRSQLVAFAQSCQCKNSNVSDFILNSLSINANDGVITCINEQNQHVRIAPKPAHKNFKQRMLSANVKKNVAVLFAMAFMVTLNIGSFQNYLSRNSSIESSAENAEEVVAAAASSSAVAAGRRLLWVESESEFNVKTNRTKRETELQVPPLHFLRPNRTNESTLTAGEQQKPTSSVGVGGGGGSKCLMNSNQTENLRLASSLHKWIGVNDYLNLSLHEKFTNGFENHMGFKLRPPDYTDIRTYDLPLQAPGPAIATQEKEHQYQQHQQKRKHETYFQRSELYGSKQRKLDLAATTDDSKNSLELFKPKISDEYMRLFKGIKRQDDTFYVLSFNTDHILLPASAYNKSTRPKMALMLPAGDPSINGDFVLMQIDCEVVNTTEVQLKSHMIPEKLRPVKFGNAPNANDVANNETGTPNNGHVPTKRPVKSEYVKTNNATVSKPFVMFVGPKERPNVFKKFGKEEQKSTTKESESKNDVLKTYESKNSTLLEKMRETIEFLP